MNAVDLGQALAKAATGEVSLANLAGLTAHDLAEVLELAIAKMTSGKNEDAVKILRSLVAFDDANPIFHEYLGLAYERTGRREAAVEAYSANLAALERLPNAGPRRCEGRLMRARLYAELGRRDDAIADLKAAKADSQGVDMELSRELLILSRALTGGVL